MSGVERIRICRRIIESGQLWPLKAHAGLSLEHIGGARKDSGSRINLPLQFRTTGYDGFAEHDAHVENDIVPGILS